MSFKRDGNDQSLLANLQKRMVGDLLSSHIPSNEAKLLSNGRYTCTVCPYRPVFDAIDVLAIHRKGKKHLQNLVQMLQNKSIINDKECSGSSKKSRTQISLSIAKSPYSSCKRRQKPTDRKISLNVKSCVGELNNASHSTPVDCYLKSIQTSRRFEDDIEYAKQNRVTRVQDEKIDSLNKSPVVQPTTSHQLNKDEMERNMKNLEKFKDGWVLDSKGVWSKDENAEFDSDEEIN